MPVFTCKVHRNTWQCFPTPVSTRACQSRHCDIRYRAERRLEDSSERDLRGQLVRICKSRARLYFPQLRPSTRTCWKVGHHNRTIAKSMRHTTEGSIIICSLNWAEGIVEYYKGSQLRMKTQTWHVTRRKAGAAYGMSARKDHSGVTGVYWKLLLKGS
jgi:hypothetical protein